MRLTLKAIFRHRSDALQNRAHEDSRGHDANRAAYRYGAEMRSTDRYRNRSWHEAESTLKSGWERLASDNREWVASRPAIRRGWDEVTPAYIDSDEPAPEAGWKARHAGQLSPWESFKDALHHGWNRVGPDMDT
jgi:hypothetical protein